jgi:hypothetical protein
MRTVNGLPDKDFSPAAQAKGYAGHYEDGPGEMRKTTADACRESWSTIKQHSYHSLARDQQPENTFPTIYYFLN